MADFAAFLKKNPGEVIIMSYQIAESEKDTTRYLKGIYIRVWDMIEVSTYCMNVW